MEYSRAALIRFEGPIYPSSEQFLKRKLAVARKAGADLVVIEIDSPGGYLLPSQRISEALRDVKWARTVAFVPQEALSGGAIVALGCDEIIVAENGRLGDAGMIQFDDIQKAWRYAPEKVQSDFARWIRDMAVAKGRSPALAEAMTDKDLEVFRMRHRETDEVAFMSQEEIISAEDEDQWEKGKRVLETREGKFLEVNGPRAVELQLATATLETRSDLRKHFNLKSDFLVLRHTRVDTAVFILNLPLITGLLFVIGLVALYVEVSAPGISVGGLIAGLCFVLFFWSHFLGGTSGWLEVILFLAGVVFLLMEIFVIPGFGVSGVTGILLLLVSVVMASHDFSRWNTSADLPSLTVTLATVMSSGVVAMVLIAVVARYFHRMPVLNRLVLRPPVASDDGEIDGESQKVKGGDDVDGRFHVSVGDWGIADSPLRPAGKARFGNEFVDVVTDGTFVDNGQQVRVIDISGNRVMVRRVDSGE